MDAKPRPRTLHILRLVFLGGRANETSCSKQTNSDLERSISKAIIIIRSYCRSKIDTLNPLTSLSLSLVLRHGTRVVFKATHVLLVSIPHAFRVARFPVFDGVRNPPAGSVLFGLFVLNNANGYWREISYGELRKLKTNTERKKKRPTSARAKGGRRLTGRQLTLDTTNRLFLFLWAILNGLNIRCVNFMRFMSM